MKVSSLLPEAPSGPVLLSPETVVLLKQAIDLLEVRFDDRDFRVIQEENGKRVLLRDAEEFIPPAGEGGESCNAFRTSLVNVAEEEEDPAMWHVIVESGLSQNKIPVVNGVSLGADPAPTVELPTNAADEEESGVWIVHDFTPITNSQTSGGQTFHYMENGGTFTNARIELHDADPNVAP